MDFKLFDVTIEIVARIMKSVARKYGADVSISYDEKNRKVHADFIGDDKLKEHVVKETENIIKGK